MRHDQGAAVDAATVADGARSALLADLLGRVAGCFPRRETRQYSGTVGGVALCQVAVTLTYATARGHALIGRALYLPETCAADEEHRELAGVPDEVMFFTKPQLAGVLLGRAQSLGIRAAFVAGDEVYGGRELRRSIRQRGMGYVLAVRANHVVTVSSGRTVTAAAAAGLIPACAWQRMRTGSGTKGTRHYDWAGLLGGMRMSEADRQHSRAGHRPGRRGGHRPVLTARAASVTPFKPVPDPPEATADHPGGG